MITSRYTIRVQAVFSFYDIFTGKMIKPGSIGFTLPENGVMTVKEGGYYVLTGCREKEFEVIIESPVYEAVAVKQVLEDTALEVQKVWLSPGKFYRLGKNDAAVTGQAEPGSTVKILCLKPEYVIHLPKDYDPKQDGCNVSVYYVGGMDMEGRTAAAVSAIKGKRRVEFVRIRSLDEKLGLCVTESPFSTVLKKSDTSIYPVFTGQADSQGNYRILLPEIPERGVTCLVSYEDGKKIREKEITVVSGT